MTIGLITIMKDGKVVLKISSRSDGGNVNYAVRRLRRHTNLLELSLCDIYKIALGEKTKYSFGSKNDLIVFNEKLFYADNMDEIAQTGTYFLDNFDKTFHKSEFNPRWESGTSDYFRIINL